MYLNMSAIFGLDECCSSNRHLTHCDDDGFCSFCGFQDVAPDSHAEPKRKTGTWAERIGPFDPKAETCQCVILTPAEPNHFKVLWCFQSIEECETAFNLWKSGK